MLSKLNRRRALKLGAFALGSTMIAPYGCKNSDKASATEQDMTKNTSEGIGISDFGIQLYTLRDIIGNDPKGVLKSLSDLGFKSIETYEGPQGLFWGMTPVDFKHYMDDLGMTLVSAHCDASKDFEEKTKNAASIGCDYMVIPWIGKQKNKDAYLEKADFFNSCGAICKEHGMRLAYHNHAYSFEQQDDFIPQDVMMQASDPDLVDFEMDIYWVVEGGADPIAYLKKYPNRFRLSHVKDRAKTKTDGKFLTCDLGSGQIDFQPILDEAKKQGMKYYLLEQEQYENSSPEKCIEIGAKYLKNFKFS